MASGSISAIIKYSQVKNNLTTTAAGGVLDARQGKALSDALASHAPSVVEVSTGTVNCANGAITALTSTTVSAGTWLFFATANWAANQNGYRQIMWNTGASVNPGRHLAVTTICSGMSGKQSYQQWCGYGRPTTSTKYTLYGVQNSGGTLTCYPAILAIKIW